MRNPRADEKLKSILATRVPYEIERGGIALSVTTNVYPTSELSELLVEAMDDPDIGVRPGALVLDYGSGTGFLAIQAAIRGARVVAIDINEDALACGRLNARKLGVGEKITFRGGKNLSALKPGEYFDLIYAGMPWDDAEPQTALERSVYDPAFTMRRALFDSAADILNPNGRIIISSCEGHDAQYPEAYPMERFDFSVVRQRTIKGLVHYAVLVTPKPR